MIVNLSPFKFKTYSDSVTLVVQFDNAKTLHICRKAQFDVTKSKLGAPKCIKYTIFRVIC
ncbi:hypothetical protein VCO01S_21140 [Vibrio comitans NBRC 102076]|uniref:Uncharacterized protein n=1 Tax=Vibrio comitans NBRC 102076 TaxID=1219078 RepID=A0A4Y3IN51_9VIBR|nr:hypothetical protein VCO01S_21140 [Vibrio comitans NBRC 102076]